VILLPAVLALGACKSDGSNTRDAGVFTAILALDNAGLHEIETEIVDSGTPPGDAQMTALRMQSVVKLTDWPKDLKALADKLANYFGDMATALGGNDKAKIKEAVSNAHEAEHDFSHETWSYLQKKAGVAEASMVMAPEATAAASPTKIASASPTMAMAKVTIESPRVRATETDVTAAYFTIKNSGAADRLVSVGIDASVAGMAQLHTMVMQGGTAMMQQVQGIDLPANGSVELKPGGFHVMIMNVKRPLRTGETIAIHLRFENAGTVEVKAQVMPITGN